MCVCMCKHTYACKYAHTMLYIYIQIHSTHTASSRRTCSTHIFRTFVFLITCPILSMRDTVRLLTHTNTLTCTHTRIPKIYNIHIEQQQQHTQHQHGMINNNNNNTRHQQQQHTTATHDINTNTHTQHTRVLTAIDE